MRSKAFFLNGGYGRQLCSIPAFEKYHEENPDDDFIIVCEGGTDAFKGHVTLDKRCYDSWHKNIFRDKIKERDIVTTEPYRVWEYYNQQCNLIQAFDIDINNKGIRELPKPKLFFSKEEILTGRKLVAEIKEKLKKDKVIVFQPFGRGIQYIDESFVDSSGRSIDFKDLKILIKKLQDVKFGIIIMSEFQFDFTKEKFKEEVAMPSNIPLRIWASIIKFSNHFLGCDSVGQHLAYTTDTLSTVITGSTFPVNISYPNSKNFEIVDLGMHDRVYDPIRIISDEFTNRHNENLMFMNTDIHNYIIDRVLRKKKDPDDK